MLRHSIIYLFFFAACIAVFPLKAQDQKKQPEPKAPSAIWDKMYLGGNIGLQFGTVTFIDVSPAVGYKVTDKLLIGVGATYLYYKYQDQYLNFSTSIYGGRAFSRYLILDNIFLQGEYELLSVERRDFPGTRTTVTSLLGGGGYRQPIGSNGFFTAVFLWNFNESVYSPYTNPIIRVGFGMGF